MLKTRTFLAIACILCTPALCAADAIVWFDPNEPGSIPMAPDSLMLFDLMVASDTPIFGYTLRLSITPEPGATGSVVLDATASDWGDPANLIEGAGETRDPDFTLLKMAGDDPNDLFATTNTEDLSTVLPVAGVNDLLLRAAVISSPDALGTWTIDFVGGVTVLSDGSFQSISATWGAATIFVPEPSCLAILACCSVLLARRRSR